MKAVKHEFTTESGRPQCWCCGNEMRRSERMAGRWICDKCGVRLDDFGEEVMIDG